MGFQVINYYELPEPLSDEKFDMLLKEAKEGSKDAFDKLVISNIRLVLYKVNKFKNIIYDEEDLVSVGIIGLLIAINTYDVSKRVKFSTYACRCIDNEILKYLTQNKKRIKTISFEDSLTFGYEEEGIKIKDTLKDDRDLASDFAEYEEKTKIYEIVREVVKQLPDKQREMLMLYFGFYNDEIYTQNQIAKKFKVSQNYVSMVKIKTIKKIRKKLEEIGFTN